MFDPRIKLVAALMYMVGCLFVDGPLSLMLAAGALLTACAGERVSPFAVARRAKPVALFLVVTALINLLLVKTGSPVFTLGPISVFTGGIAAAILYGARFFLLVLAGGLLLISTGASALTEAARRLCSPLEKLGVPVGTLAVTFTLALRFAPILARDARSIVHTQIARGASFEQAGLLERARAYIPLAVPLLASVTRHAEALADAMEARCYTGGERTSLHAMRVRFLPDIALLAVMVFYLFAVIAL